LRPPVRVGLRGFRYRQLRLDRSRAPLPIHSLAAQSRPSLARTGQGEGLFHGKTDEASGLSQLADLLDVQQQEGAIVLPEPSWHTRAGNLRLLFVRRMRAVSVEL